MNDQDTSGVVMVDGEEVLPEDLVAQYQRVREDNRKLYKMKNKAERRYLREEELKPYQAELIRLQKYLEETGTR
jgi:hypothetical protein